MSDGVSDDTVVDRPAAWPDLTAAQRAILRDVLVHGSRSRAELARRSGMSRASLSRLTRELSVLGLLREGEALTEERRGRPSERIDLVPGAAGFLGVKLTGDSLYVAVSDLGGGVIHSEGQPLMTTGVGDVVAQIASVAARIRRRYPSVVALGVCLAGDVRFDDGRAIVLGSAFLGWEEVSLQALLEDASGLPVTVSNDVQALTIAHHWFGPGVGQDPFALVAVGAGIGSGLVVGDEPVRGARGRPGRIDHLPVTPDGPECMAGHVGCVSAYATIPAVLRNSGLDGFWETLEAAKHGNERPRRAIDGAATALGAVVATIANLADPARIVLTGEGLAVAEIARNALDRSVRARLDPRSEMPDVHIRAFEFTDYAWGAAVTSIRALLWR